ncbi:DUF5801 repeats-in-toxin domain-containing protein [Pseudovibrio denitrificans]|uniref:DUF5801 repeats-in-toxin domain-containing protein n=1 Tax=Pseudovibrio denitrificans TaxID=258256 RepID=UPI0039BEEDFE
MSERQASSTNTATNTSQATIPPQTLKIGVVAEGSSEVLVRQPGQLVDFSQMLEVPVSLFRYGESLQILFSGGGTLLVEGFFTGDQTDASLILSENQTLTIEEFGALVEILPVDTLQTAAGDGTPIADQLEEPGSSGQDFDDNPDGGPLGPGLNVNDLLKPEDNAGAAAANDDPEQDVDDVPVAGIAEVGALDETDWADAGKGPLSFTGNLNVDFGLDGVTERSLQFQLDNGVPVDRAGNPLSLTADGQPLSYEVQDLTADAANEIGDGSQLLTAKLPNGEVVFEVLLNTFTETGAYTFTLRGNLDHLEADVKDILALEFGFQAFDTDGDSADSFLIVNVADDLPEIGEPTTGTVDEDGIPDIGNNNDNADGDAPATSNTITASLDIDWGADDADSEQGGVGDRSVKFAGTPEAPQGLSSESVALVYSLSDDGTELTATKGDGGEAVFKVTLSDDAAGTYSFELMGPLDHPVANTEDDINLTFDFVATDSDGDTANSSFTVIVDDDLADITSLEVNKYVQVDESAGLDNDDTTDTAVSDLFANVAFKGSDEDMEPQFARDNVVDFSYDNGADGATHTVTLSIEADGMSSGLQTTSGDDILLYLQDGLVVGRVGGADGDAVFAIAIDEAGEVSLAQYQSIKQPDTSDHDEFVNLDGKISAVLTVTDGDGDVARQDIAIGEKIRFGDDGPTITSLEVNKYVQVDESAGLDNDDTTDTAVSDLFANVAFKGSDEDMEPQFARDNVVDFAYDNGADGATHTVTLSIEADGMSSGLQTTSGDDILLYLQDGLVVGRVGDADGDAVFAIAIDEAGEVSLAQYQSIKQPDTSDHDEFVNLDGKISAVLTVTDGDGDVARQDIAIGEKIRFGDDGPTITSLEVNKYVQVDESAGLDNDDTTDTAVSDLFANVADKGSDEDMEPQFARDNVVDFAYDNGADGATHTVTLSIDDANSGLQTTAGEDILLYLENGLVVGRVGDADGDAVFAIAIDEAGEVSLAQYQSIKQLDTSDHDEFVNLDGKISAVLTVTDGDGDVARQDIAIGEKIRFGDDGPTITSLEVNKYVQVDESAGLDNDDTTDTAVSDLFANVADKGSDEDMEPQFARDNVVDFAYDNGADGATHTVTLSIDDANSGLQTTAGEDILLYLENGLVVGRVGDADGDAVFAIAIDEAGEVSLAQYQSIKQLDTSDHDEFVNLDGKISAVLTVTDGDGDVASKSIEIGEKIRFGDDGPSLTGAEQGVTVDEDDIDTIFSTGTSPDYWGFEGDESLTEFWTGAAISFGDLQGVVNYGADGDAGANSFTFVNDATQQLTSLGLTSDGDSIQFDSLQLTPNITLMLGVANGRPVIGLALNSETGEFAVLQADQLDHVAGNGENTALQLSDGTTIDAIDFGSVIVARDGDGDTVELGGKLDVTVVDDVPEPHIWVDDHIRIDETEGDHSDNVPAKGRIRKLFKDVEDKGSDPDLSGPIYARNDVLDFHRHVGADERGSHELIFRIDDAASGLTTTEGEAITLTLEDGQIVGRVPSGEAAFAIHLHQNGKVSMVQYMSIEHPDTDSSDEHVSLDGKVTAILTVTDEDGDAVSTEIAVGDLLTFDDDGPRVTNQQRDVTIDEDDIDTPLSTGTSPDYWGIEGDGNWTDFWTGSAINTGSLQGVVDFGADGDADSGSFTFAGDAEQQLTDLGLTSDGDAVEFQSVQLNAKLTLMVGIADGRPVIGLILNSETGEFAVLQADQLDHVTGDGENTALQLSDGSTIDAIDFGSVIVATDGDGDTVDLDGKLDVTVVDDVPEPHIWVDDHIRIDETEGPHSDNIPPWFGFNTFKDVDDKGSDLDLSGPIYARNDVLDFHRHVGADERGSHELVFRIDDAASGLTTTEGEKITLTLEDGQIVGRVPSGEAAFAIHLHQNGNVSMVQYMSIKHPDTNSSDEHVSLDGKVTAVLTVTDEDGDEVSTEISVGHLLTFDDDGPHIEEFFTTGETVELDETSGLQHDEVNAAPGSSIRALFAAVENDAATDPDMETIFAQQQGILDAEIFGGADGVSDDDIAVTLEISTEGLNSGLQTTEGVPINLYTEGDLIVGRAGDGDASVIFAVSIDDNGTVSVVQYASLEHAQPGQDDSLDLGDLIVARLTITDGDGDTDTATTVIGDKIIFHDDEPDAIRSGSQIAVDEAADLGAVVSGQLQFEEGADGATVTGAHFRNSQGYVRRYDMEEPQGQRGDFLTVGGEKIVLSSTTDANGIITLEGTTETSGSSAFTVVVQPDGSYEFTQILGFDHPDAGETGSDDSIDLRLRFTVTDGDGDTSTATAVISVQDDEVVLTGDAVTAKADEDDIVGDRSGVPGNQPNDGNGDGSTTGANDVKGPAYVTENISNLVDFGNDGGAFVIAADAVSTLEGMDLKSGGEKLSYVVIGNKLVGYLETTGDTEYSFADDHPVFSLELTSDSGDVVFKLFDQLDHVAGHLDNEHSGELLIDFGSVIDAVDGDGDRVNLDGKFTIQIVDDVPYVDYNAYEKNLVVNGSFEQPVIGSSYNFFSSIDGWQSTNGTGFEIHSDSFSQPRDGEQYLELDMDAGGAVDGIYQNIVTEADTQYELLFSLADRTDNGPSSEVRVLWNGVEIGVYSTDSTDWTNISVNVVGTGQDGGDRLEFVEVSGSSQNNGLGTYLDHIQLYKTAGYVDEAALGGAAPVVATDSLGISWGADDVNTNTGSVGDRSVVFDTSSTNPPSGLSSDGVQLVYEFSADGTTLKALKGAGGDEVFTVTLSDADAGSYTFTLIGNLDHDVAGSEEELLLYFSFTAKDSDGDTAPGSFRVVVNDDLLEIGSPLASTVDEDGLLDGNKDSASGDAAATSASVSDVSLDINWGADNANSDVGGTGDRSVTFASNSVLPAGVTSDGVSLVYTLSQGDTVLTATKAGSSEVVFVVTLSDEGTGSYSFELKGNLDHPAGADENDINLSFEFVATDGDGDTASSSFTVTVDDDMPVIGAPADSVVDEDGLAAGNKDDAPGDAAATEIMVDDVALKISWGADNANSGAGDRSVTFASNSVMPAGLSSDGVSLVYTLSHGDTVLTATKAGTSEVVFVVTLSDEDTGFYSFDLKGNLDHPAGDDENDIGLTFNFVAKDSDGDTASSNFTVTVDDDSPVLDDSVYGQNLVVNGSFEDPDIGSKGHKAVDTMSGWMSTNGTRFEIHSNSFSPSSDGEQYLELDKDGAGSGKVDGIYQNIITDANTQYELSFDLADRVHNGQGSDVRVLWNGVEVGEGVYSTDSTDWSNFTITVVGTGQAGGDRLEFIELTTPGQNNGLGTYLDNIELHKVGPIVDEADIEDGSAVASDELHIKWGTDDATSGANARAVTFADSLDGTVARTDGNTDLKSAGSPVFLKSFGAVLIGYTDVVPQSATDTGDAVFTVTLSSDGSGAYTFELLGQLDHEGAEAEDLSLTFDFVATDSDGDGVSGEFTVNIVDDVPTGAADNASGEEDVSFKIDVLANDDVGADKAATILLENDGETAQKGTVTVNPDGTVQYTSPHENFNGSDSFSYVIEDADGDRSEVITVTVEVTPVNDRPELTVTNVQSQFAENGTGPVAEFSAFDVEGDALTYSLTGDDAHLFEIRGNEVYFKAAPDFENPLDVGADQEYDFNIVVSDGEKADSEDISVSVTNQAAELNLFFKPGSSAAFTVRDDFEADGGTYQYSNQSDNIGPIKWESDWIEGPGLDGLQVDKDVYVPQQGGSVSGHLYFPHWIPNGSGSISRSVDLTNGENLKLEVSVGNLLEFGDDQFDLVIEWDGGSARVPMFDQSTAGRSEVITIDISNLPGWNPSETTITFDVSGMEGSDDYARVLDVKIFGDIVTEPITEHDVAFTLGGEGVAIADMLEVDDGDNNAANNQLTSAVITLKDYQQGDALSYIPQGAYAGISATTAVVGGNLVLTLSGDASHAAYVEAIKAIKFNTSSSEPLRTIEMVVSDGSEESGVVSTNVTVGSPLTGVTKHVSIQDWNLQTGYDEFVGTAGDDVIYGSNHWKSDIEGGLGNDHIDGHSGSDLLNGGAGFDIISSGDTEDEDTFIFDVLDGSFDRITDFDGTVQGEVDLKVDQLDISALLNKAFGDDEIDAAEAGQYVKIQENGSGSDVLVDVDGTANGENWSKIAHLDNISQTDTIKVVLDDDGSYTQVDVVA